GLARSKVSGMSRLPSPPARTMDSTRGSATAATLADLDAHLPVVEVDAGLGELVTLHGRAIEEGLKRADSGRALGVRSRDHRLAHHALGRLGGVVSGALRQHPLVIDAGQAAERLDDTLAAEVAGLGGAFERAQQRVAPHPAGSVE